MEMWRIYQRYHEERSRRARAQERQERLAWERLQPPQEVKPMPKTPEQALAELRKHPQQYANIVQTYRAQARAIESDRYQNENWKRDQLAALKEQMRVQLMQLQLQGQLAVREAHLSVAQSQPQYDRQTLDSAWQRARELLDKRDVTDLAPVFALLARQGGAMRAALNEGLPLYLAGRQLGAKEEDVQRMTGALLAQFRQQEMLALTPEERAVRTQLDELQTGLQFQQVNYEQAKHAIETGETMPYAHAISRGEPPIPVEPIPGQRQG